MSEQFLTAQEVAAKMGLSPKNGWRTVIRLADTGKIGFMKFGRLRRFSLDDIMAYGYKQGSGGQLNKRFLRHK